MNLLRQALIQQFNHSKEVSGVVLHNDPMLSGSSNRGAQYTVLVISIQQQHTNTPNYYIKEGYRIQEQWMTISELENKLLQGEDDYGTLVGNGEILIDINNDLQRLQNYLERLPERWRQQLLLKEFSKFIKQYLRAKNKCQAERYMDAYTRTVQTIEQWARVVIIESGNYPNASVWEHVKKINAGVYKLYEELILSMESLIQRVQLALLACEFAVMSKMESCCKLLLDLLENQSECWTVRKLASHPEIKCDPADIELLLRYLLKKALVSESTGKLQASAAEGDIFLAEEEPIFFVRAAFS